MENNSNQVFSSQRFATLLKTDIAVNKSNYLKLIIGGIGIFAAVALLVSIIAVIDINSLKQSSGLLEAFMDDAIKTKQQTYATIYDSISIWILSIGLTILGSLTFSNMSTKRQRISSLMIPASRPEKFCLRALIYPVGGTITLIVGFFIGLCIDQIAFGGGFEVFKGVTVFFGNGLTGIAATIFILMYLLGVSMYVLGSALWPRLSWIKTWMVLMVIEWIGILIMIIISTANISWFSFFEFWSHHIDALKWIMISVLILLNIACWACAWIRYKNTQIIQRFMTK